MTTMSLRRKLVRCKVRRKCDMLLTLRTATRTLPGRACTDLRLDLRLIIEVEFFQTCLF